MSEEIKSNVLSSEIWIRLVLMLLFGIITSVSLWLVWLVTALQFLFALITGKPNHNLGEFADGLSAYIGEMLAFLMFRSEHRPFPFSPLPGTASAEKQAAPKQAAPKKKAKATAPKSRTTRQKAESGSSDNAEPAPKAEDDKPAGDR